MNTKFDELVRSLDHPTLDLLRQSVAQEVETRRLESSIQLEQIHARMSDAERQQAAQEIARVLNEEGQNG